MFTHMLVVGVLCKFMVNAVSTGSCTSEMVSA